jgi:hypothetical protein
MIDVELIRAALIIALFALLTGIVTVAAGRRSKKLGRPFFAVGIALTLVATVSAGFAIAFDQSARADNVAQVPYVSRR